MALDISVYARNKIRSEMRARGVTSIDMCNMLEEKLGILLLPQSFNNKISRANFTASFFFQCIYVLGVKNMNIEMEGFYDKRVNYEKKY